MRRFLYSSLPSKPGVYLFKNEKNNVLYVGKAKDLKKRVASYFRKAGHDVKTTQLVSAIKSIDHIVVGSEIEAFLLEANLIKKYTPFYNIRLSDDKFYPYLQISKGENPYVIISRKKNDLRVQYYGPYTSTQSLKIVLKILRKIFPYQSVKNHPKRRCLYHHLGLCPCTPVFPDNLVQASKNIRFIEHFLEGNKNKVVKMLSADQKEYIKKEEFEKAADNQKKIERINQITDARYDPFKYMERPDFYYERIANELDSLKKILTEYGLTIESLHRIECYDISNFSGKQATGSMVVFIDGDTDKREYRKFKIQTKDTPDDFAMHQEMMRRRLRNDWEKPGLFVIDGGKGQVSAVLEVLVANKVQIPVIGLAKREETIIAPIRTLGHLEFRQIKLPLSTPAVNLLRRIRDEAHRFAITYHRLLRKKHFLAT